MDNKEWKLEQKQADPLGPMRVYPKTEHLYQEVPEDKGVRDYLRNIQE